ncbi:AAA family ATPase [Indioceanicola profundi]|uniref:AAA family ATPase n=1 Tax=Indioceanicola profundi TaxID=2220096 RepID=UPI001CEC89C7|nr:AAA family ATPase [Indioceanicola profundi]
MDGVELKRIREARGSTQQEFADWLNGRMNRAYDKSRISRWESGKEVIPQDVGTLLAPRRQREQGALVVAVANQKGGVGKTATSVNLAYALASRDYRVLLIDFDPQGSATVHLGVDPVECEEAGQTTYEVLVKGLAATTAVRPVMEGAFDLLPAAVTLAAAEQFLIQDEFGVFRLRDEVLPTLRANYDVILLDCPPQLGRLTMNALIAADRVLIPVQTERLSLMGFTQLMENITRARMRNPSLSVLGVLPTMFTQRQGQDQRSLSSLKELCGEIRMFTPVPRATAFANAVEYGVPVLAASGLSDTVTTPFAEMVEAVGQAIAGEGV